MINNIILLDQTLYLITEYKLFTAIYYDAIPSHSIIDSHWALHRAIYHNLQQLNIIFNINDLY